MADSPVGPVVVEAGWGRRFFSIWGGQAASLFGSSLVQFALVWWLTLQTGSATVLATASLVALLPQVFLAPLAGAFVDRNSRKAIMLISDGLVALLTLVLVALFATGAIMVWHIYVVMFLRSAAGAFQAPAMQASTTLMVPNQHLARVGGLNQMLQGFMSIVAPPVAALLIARLPIEQVLFIDTLTALLGMVPVLLQKIPQPPASSGVKVTFWQDFKAGYRYAVGWRGLLLLMLMAALINFLLTPAGSLLPLLVKNHFGGGADQLALVEMLFGIGLIVGGVLMGVWGGFKNKMITSLVGMFGLGLAVLVVAVTPSNLFVLAVAANAVLGVTVAVTNAPIGALLQSVVPPDMQGRIFTLLNAIAQAISPISLLLAGPIADTFGIQAWYLVGGVVCLLVAMVALRTPALVHLERDAKAKRAPAEAGA
jgi:MFS transporter, DHA3 family, macrolide efflux protein